MQKSKAEVKNQPEMAIAYRLPNGGAAKFGGMTSIATLRDLFDLSAQRDRKPYSKPTFRTYLLRKPEGASFLRPPYYSV